MKNKKTFSILILTIALLLAFVTRFYKLGSAPAGLNSDEAGEGYSAYSILKTGKDEFGKSFPVLFRSSGDFKTPVYTYLIVPLIPVFGLTPFTVRLPSAFFGVLTIPILYFLVKKLSKREDLSLVSAILLAISPWHILFSRTGYEANVALFLFLTGLLIFFHSLKRPWLLIISAILFAIAIPAYHSERVVAPLIGLVIFLRYRKILLSKTHFIYLIAGAVVAFIISLPTLSVARTPGFYARVSDLNILAVGKPAGILENYHGFLAPVVNNKIILSVHELGSLYLSYFSPRFMFILGDSGPRSSFPELSTFFVWQFPFYIYGLYLVVKKKELSELSFFTISFLLIAPIPASFTRDPYSSTRALQMVIPLTIIISLAIAEIFTKLKNKNLKIIFWLTSVLIIIYSLLKLYSSAIVLNEYYRTKAWEYGWQKVTDTIKTLGKNPPIIVDNSRNVGYIQLAFFLKADPVSYQKQNFEITPEEYYTNMASNLEKHIEKIVTHPIDWEHDLKEKKYLIGDEFAISTQQIKEHNLTLIKEIYYPNGEVAFRIVETNPKLFPSK